MLFSSIALIRSIFKIPKGINCYSSYGFKWNLPRTTFHLFWNCNFQTLSLITLELNFWNTQETNEIFSRECHNQRSHSPAPTQRGRTKSSQNVDIQTDQHQAASSFFPKSVYVLFSILVFCRCNTCLPREITLYIKSVAWSANNFQLFISLLLLYTYVLTRTLCHFKVCLLYCSLEYNK